MSGKDDKKRGGKVVNLPRIFMPGSFNAHEPGEAGPDSDGEQAPPVGQMPRLFGIGHMAPPVPLTMPGVPTGSDDEPAEDADGSFALPMLGDPENPTARGALAVAVALMTAMGVAAAQGMWHRARHRQALADQSRAAADRSKASAAGARASRSSGGSGPLLRSPGGGSGGSKGSRAFGSRTGGHGTPGHGSTGRDGKKRRPPGADAAHGPHRPPKRDKDTPKAPKAGKGGKPTTGPKGNPSKVKGGTTPKPATGAAAPTTKPGKPSSSKKPSPAPMPKLAWKAPAKGTSPAKGSKRWTRHPGTRPVPAAKQPSTKGTAKRIGQARKVAWKAQKGTKAGKGPKRWTPPRPSAARRPPKSARPRKSWKAPKTSRARKRWTASGSGRKGWTVSSGPSSTKGRKRWTTTTTSSGSTGSSDAAGGRHQARTPPPPPRFFAGMRPPPGAFVTPAATAEQVDSPSQQPPQARPVLALTEGSLPMLEPAPAVKTTQYRDAELTIRDVVEAAADMAVEIGDGVVEAQRTEAGCDALLDRLEVLHAKIVELKVPGVLAGMVLALMEKTAVVKAKAEAIRVNLPRAAEAISIAGSNAAARHLPLADAVRDAGHIRPAERDYHNE
ncbi:hypothetical protein [Microbispora rosea]|uniref:hypothetical protein n=1 Tax=Microbispora rosea TaxID=58117 RepID=UPI0037A37187